MTADPDDKYTWDYNKEWKDNSNLLGLIVFSIVTGINMLRVSYLTPMCFKASLSPRVERTGSRC